MKYTDIKAIIITLDEDFFYKLEEIANKWCFETKSADFLDFTFTVQEDFKRILVNLLSNYKQEKDFYNDNLQIEWLEEIPISKANNQYILIRDGNNLKKM